MYITMYICFDTGPETLLASLRPAISPDIPGKMKNKTGKGCFTIAKKKGQSFFAMLPTSDMGAKLESDSSIPRLPKKKLWGREA